MENLRLMFDSRYFLGKCEQSTATSSVFSIIREAPLKIGVKFIKSLSDPTVHISIPLVPSKLTLKAVYIDYTLMISAISALVLLIFFASSKKLFSGRSELTSVLRCGASNFIKETISLIMPPIPSTTKYMSTTG